MYKTKYQYTEMVKLELQNDWPNRDNKLDDRDIILRIDAIVNEMAKQNFFENWKFSSGVDEQFITTWENLTVTDGDQYTPSFFTLPAAYAALINNGGIDEVYTMKNPMSLPILSASDMRMYKNNLAGGLQGKPGFYPVGITMRCTIARFNAKYGKVGLRLVIRDSSAISSTEPYPIPADKEQEVITRAVQWFRLRREQVTDRVRDLNDPTT